MRYFFLLLLLGCSTPTYLVKQGLGQLKIQWSSTPNERVLSDPKVSDEVKFKIRLIEDAKKFFEAYFAHPAQGIYSQTTFLDEKAVTWLVVASRPDAIEAVEHSFPFLGAFPYLGFYQRSDAESFAEELEREGLVTFQRPVYAYSTLGYLEDRILSSFFQYEEVELVELVFHEMFHTLFFVKDHVDLNENMASYFSDQLLNEYYKDSPKLAKYRADAARGEAFEAFLVATTRELMAEFEKLRPNLSTETANAVTGRFVREIILPELRKLCAAQERDAEDCPDQEEKWNQARLAALMTYQDEQDILKDIVAARKLGLRELLGQIRAWYKQWEKGDQDEEFAEFLKSRVKT